MTISTVPKACAYIYAPTQGSSFVAIKPSTYLSTSRSSTRCPSPCTRASLALTSSRARARAASKVQRAAWRGRNVTWTGGRVSEFDSSKQVLDNVPSSKEIEIE